MKGRYFTPQHFHLFSPYEVSLAYFLGISSSICTPYNLPLSLLPPGGTTHYPSNKKQSTQNLKMIMMLLFDGSGRLTIASQLILLVLFFPLAACGTASNKNGGSSSLSPVRELGPSLAASVAGGTVIAVRSSFGVLDTDGMTCKDVSLDSIDNKPSDGDDGSVVLLFRSINDSSDSNGGKSNREDVGRNLTVASVFGSVDSNKYNNNNYNPDGLAFLPNGPVSSNRNNNLRVLHADSGLVMAATGFASDAEHLINVAAGRVLSRISVYDAPAYSSLTSGKSVDPHRLVREDVSSMMIDAAMSDGGRPWGVQLLVVGQSALSRDQLLDIYTIDPSGGWRHRHGTIAAIGRGAERIAASTEDLTKCRFKSNGWRRALDVAMNAAVDTFERNEDASNIDISSDPGRYSAVVIFGKRTTSRCAAVCPDVIEECYKRIIFPDRLEEQQADS